MAKIKSIHALEILDSRGTPTIEVIVTTDNHITGKAKIPSGASTGVNEALELRDNDKNRYKGKGVLKAIANVQGPLKKILVGKSIFEQEEIDNIMIRKDGTENKSNFGANAILGISMAVARAAAKEKKIPLYRYLGGEKANLLPCPIMNIINGGAHGDNLLEFQEFMIRPIGMLSFKEAIRCGCEIFYTLKSILKSKGYSTSVGDEGGFAPQLSSNEEALSLIFQAIEKAGYKQKTDVSIALDLAASEFFNKETKTYIEIKKKKLNQNYLTKTSEEQVQYIIDLCKKFPIDSIEDGLDENDWEGFKFLTQKLSHLQIVGDDLYVTNTNFLKRGIKEKSTNAILIKLNQIGTLTETLKTIHLAQENDFNTIISHRSGETDDTFIADLAVATQSGQIKTGSLSRSDRVEKYNRLLEIEDELGNNSHYYKY